MAIVIILLLSGQRVFAIWKKAEIVHEGYYDVGMKTKVMISIVYFGLMLFLVFAMSMTHYEAEVERPSLDADYYLNRGDTYWKKGQYDQAISDYTKAIEINPKLPQPYVGRGAVYLFCKREYDQAWDDVHKAQDLGYQVPTQFLKALREASGRQE